MRQRVVIYGSTIRPRVYTTVYDDADVTLQLAYCERAHPGQHPRVADGHAITYSPP